METVSGSHASRHDGFTKFALSLEVKYRDERLEMTEDCDVQVQKQLGLINSQQLGGRPLTSFTL